MVKILLAEKTNWNIDAFGKETSNSAKDIALIYAATGGHFEIVQALLAAKANPKAKMRLPYTSETTALQQLIKNFQMHDVETKKKKLVEILLTAGAEVNTYLDGNKTLLMTAVYTNNKEIVERLLKAGADVNAKSFNGDTALMVASRYAFDDMIKIILKSGADVNAKNNSGKTALSIVKKDPLYKEILRLLKEAGAKE